MERTWILVADASYARIFEVDEDGEWKLLREFEHVESREQGQDLMGTRPWQIQHRAEYDAKGTNPDLHGEQAEKFAKELSKHLEVSSATNRYARLAVVAPPKFLGLLRDNFPNPVSRKVTVELSKDYTTLRPDRMAELVPLF